MAAAATTVAGRSTAASEFACVAEMAGAFVCASLGIVPTVRHADYIGSWLEVLREDNRAVVRAAASMPASNEPHGIVPAQLC